MRKPLRYSPLIALLTVLALPQTCLACSCAVMEAPTTALTRAPAVFRGRAIGISSEQDWSRGSLSHYQRVTFRVDESWKGPTTHEVVVFTSLGDSVCGYPFVQGEDYLVYAFNTSSPSGLPAGLGTGICNRTRPLNSAADDLHALGPGTPIEEPPPSQVGDVGDAQSGTSPGTPIGESPPSQGLRVGGAAGGALVFTIASVVAASALLIAAIAKGRRRRAG